jgi:hypothetical protein
MIDQMSDKGYAELSSPATVTSSGAGSGILSLLTVTAGAAGVNGQITSAPQGVIAFLLDSIVSTGSGSMVTVIQSGGNNSADNSNFANVASFTSVSNVANTAGLQVLFVDSAILTKNIRAYDFVTGTASATRTVTAVFVQKNPS